MKKKKNTQDIGKNKLWTSALEWYLLMGIKKIDTSYFKICYWFVYTNASIPYYWDNSIF